ncbi:MAG: DUF3084 domain-containing protein [Bacillota bacterium]
MFGFFLLISVAVLGGLIAFVGDRVGMRVGRKRLSLFGLRPKYTSMVIAVITGVLAATSTLGVSSIVSENVRIALFHLTKLRRDLAFAQSRNLKLKKEYQQLDEALRQVNLKWRTAQGELAKVAERLAILAAAQERAEKELNEARKNLAAKAADLERLEAEYARAKAEREAAEKEVKFFQQRKENLENAITLLENQIDTLSAQREYLGTGVLDFATRPIILHVGEVLAATVIRPGNSFAEVERLMVTLLNKADQIAKTRGAVIEGKSVATRVDMKRVTEAYKVLLNLQVPAVVRVVSGTNVVAGKPAFVYPEVLPDEMVFRRGEVVATVILEGEESPARIFARLLGEALREGKKAAEEKSMVDSAGQSAWPEIDLDLLQETAAKAAKLSGRREVRFLAARDLHRAGETLSLTPLLAVDAEK